MNKAQHKNKTTEFLKRLPLLLTIATALAGQSMLTACASVNRKEESIDAILQKENALIEKLQAERARPEIEQAISENDSLRKAEAHLALGFEELLNANKTVRKKILKTNKEEVTNGQN